MKNLAEYISTQDINVNEGLIKSGISLITLNKINPEHLLEGILNMYDYIVDNDNMELFYQDFPVKEQVLWKNLYELYSKKVWSIIDVDTNNEQISSWVEDSFPQRNELIDVTTNFRRHLRKFIKESKNNNLNIKPSEPDKMMIIDDKVNSKSYIVTINRTTGILSRLIRGVDKKYLEKAFSKLNGE